MKTNVKKTILKVTSKLWNSYIFFIWLLFIWNRIFSVLLQLRNYSISFIYMIRFFFCYLHFCFSDWSFFFVWTWNSHHIQKQSKHLHVIHEKSYMNYNHSLEKVFNHDSSIDHELLRELQKDVEKFDMILDFLILYEVYWQKYKCEWVSF